MGCLIGAMTFFNGTLGEQSYWWALWSRTSNCKDRTDLLNGQALFDAVFKWCLSDLQINV